MSLLKIVVNAWNEARKQTGEQIHDMGEVSETHLRTMAILVALIALVFITASSGNVLDNAVFVLLILVAVGINHIPLNIKR